MPGQVSPTDSGYEVVWGDYDLGFEVTDIEDTGSEFACNARLYVLSTSRTVWGPTFIDLLSTQDLLSVSSAIDRDCALPDVSWVRLLQEAASLIVDEDRSIPRYVRLSDVEVPSRDRVYLFDRFILHNQTNLLIADGQSGKSYLALYLSVCCANGIPFLDRYEVTTPGPVLYVDYETDHEIQVERLDRICRGMDSDKPRDLYIMVERRPIRLAGKAIKSAVDSLGAKLVVLDSVGPACSGDIERASAALTLMRTLKMFGCTVIAIAHLSKAARSSTSDRTAIGSIMFANMARSCWALERAEPTSTEMRCILRHTKVNVGRKLGNIPYSMTFVDDPPYSVTFAPLSLRDAPELAVFLSLREQIWRVLYDIRSADAKEIARKVGETERTVQNELNRMVASGQVTHDGDGMYSLGCNDNTEEVYFDDRERYTEDD